MSRRIPFVVITAAVCVALTMVPGRAQTQNPPPAQNPPAQTPPPAQTGANPQQPQTTFRLRVDSVSVDVTVTDKQGRPVLDLQPTDFEVRESKKLQKVETFRLIKIDDLDPGPPRDILSFADQERELGREGTRLIVIFLDDYHTRRINSMRIRESLAQWVTQLSSNDLIAITTPLMPANGLTFTYNHDAMARNVLGFEGRKYDYTPRNPIESSYQNLPPEQIEQIRNTMVIQSLEALCSYVGALRQGRKMVLYISEGMTTSLPANLITGLGQVGIGGLAQQSQQMDLQNRLMRVYQAAARGNVSISTLDPKGLTMSEGTPADARAAEIDRQVLLEASDQMRNLANETDGRAMVGSNDPTPGLRQMVRDLSAYYLLGYTTQSPHDGKFHDIQVKVARKDIEVHARKGYWAQTEEEVARILTPAPKAAPPKDVTEALDALTNDVELASHHSVRSWVGAVRGTGDKARVTVAWESTAAMAPTDPAEVVDHVTLTAVSIYGDQLFNGRIDRDPQATRPSGTVSFDAPGGGIRIRLVAENARGTRLDSSDREVSVPAFTAGKALVSPPIVYRGRTARDMQQLRTAASPMPSITREFSRAERLLMRFQVMGPSVPAGVTMQLLNPQGVVMSSLPSPVATTDGGYEAELGLGSLPAGDYIIEIDADFGGQKARTMVAIRVTG